MYPCWGPIAFFWQLGQWFGQTMSCWHFFWECFRSFVGQNINVTIVWVHARPVTTPVPYFHLHIIWDGSLMKSFAGLLQILVVLWVSQCFVEVDARFRGVLIRNTNIDTTQQSTTANAWEGYQTTDLGISERPLCSWKVLCTGMESNGGKLMWKFDDFIVNLGGPSTSTRSQGL